MSCVICNIWFLEATFPNRWIGCVVSAGLAVLKWVIRKEKVKVGLSTRF